MDPSIDIPQEAASADVVKVTEGALMLAGKYANYAVATAEEYTAGAEHLKGIKAAMSQVDEERFKITRPQDAAKKRVMEFFGQFTNRLIRAETAVKKGLLTYSNEQDRIQREERRKEEERQRKEEDKLRQASDDAREQGRADRADILEDRADSVALAPTAPVVSTPKVSGISTRPVWKFEIMDPKLVPDEYKTIDEKKIGGVVRALKDLASIPGVRIYSEKTMSAGRG